MNPTGKKQVREAVTIAVLCTLASGLVNWGVEVVREKCQPKAKRKKKKLKTEEKPEHDTL
jgi:hypothetical protein